MKKIILAFFIIAILSLFFLWFISDRDRGLWVLTTALKISNPISVKADISYGDKAWQTLDIYPQNTSSPVVIFIHGGSWRHGRKDQYRFAADAFHRLGYTVVLPDYIKYPNKEAHYPSFAIDAAKAIAWVKANIRQHQGDANNIFLAGHSAGAHTALMVATDSQFLNSEGLSEKDIRAVAGIAGPYNFIPDSDITKAVFGPKENYPLMNAINYVNGQEPPTLLLHSEADKRVGKYNQETLAAKLFEAKVDIKTLLYKDLSHTDMVTHLHPWFNKKDEISADIDRFFRNRLKPN